MKTYRLNRLFQPRSGRNVIQHANPVGITRALMAIVHESATARDALKMLA